jgi:acyl-CoA synthetase (AMP-forming)/AMP-acid ligase II
MVTWAEKAFSPEDRLTWMGPGAPFEMVEEKVLGSTMDVFARRPANLRQALLDAAERFGDRPYLVFPDRTYTFASIVPAVASVASILRETYGVEAGDRVAIAASNCPGFALTFWAAASLGAITVALNGWWTGPELMQGIELTEPTVLLGDQRRLGRLEGYDLAIPTVVFEEEWESIEHAVQDAPFPDQPINEDDPAMLLFTSGTTGRAKAATISHRSNLHFLQCAILGGIAHATSEEGKKSAAPALSGSSTLGTSPMFHVSGLNATLVQATLTGLKIVYPTSGRWQEDIHLQLTADHDVTGWSLVPTQLWRLLNWHEFDRYDLSSLTSVGGGSAVWPPELIRLLKERLPSVKVSMAFGYGMTETSGLGTILREPDLQKYPDSVGRACPTVDVAIMDPEDGTPMVDGEVGEICLRTPAGFLGYWGNEEASAAAFHDDRWYRTGDLGHLEDGLLYLSGRRSDLIVRGGENIYPAEVENRLIEHPDVDEVAVIGVDHPTLGQEVRAVVVLRSEAVPDEIALREWAGTSLAPFKVPSSFEFRTELPHNATGKVSRHLLAHPDEAKEGGGE